MNFLIVVTFVVFTRRATTAFSNGAGQCSSSGQAAVGGPHLTAGSITTGLLQDAGFTMRGLSTLVPHQNLFTVGNAIGNSIELGIAGTSSGFRGVLLQVTGSNDDSVLLEPGDGLQIASVCGDTPAVTHEDASIKNEVTADLAVSEEAVLDVDVTVVVQNSGGVSEYYHSRFQMQLIGRSLDALFEDCLDDLREADADDDQILTLDEYTDFLQRLGEERCYDSLGQVTAEQQSIFESFSCSFCMEDTGQDYPTCCTNPVPDTLSVVGASTGTDRQRARLRTFCQYAYSRVPPSCGETNVATASPVASPVQTAVPTDGPTAPPVVATTAPVAAVVTPAPTSAPTLAPVTSSPTAAPVTPAPTPAPTTAAPTPAPTSASPTKAPTPRPTAAPTAAGVLLNRFRECYQDMVEADNNSDGLLGMVEFYKFVVLRGEDRCYTPRDDGQLTNEQSQVFFSFSCLRCFMEGLPEDPCCTGADAAISVSGSTNPEAATPSELEALVAICQATENVLRDERCPTAAPTDMVPPSAPPTAAPVVPPTDPPTSSPVAPPPAPTPVPPVPTPVPTLPGGIPPRKEVPPDDSKDDAVKLFGDGSTFESDRGSLVRNRRRLKGI